MANKKLTINASHWVIIIALLCASLACYYLISPYLNAIVMAFIVSLLMQPIHQKVESQWPNSPNTSATLSCVLLTVMIIIPLSLVAIALIDQGSKFFQNLLQWVSDGGVKTLISHPLVDQILSWLNAYLPGEAIDLESLVQKAVDQGSNYGTEVVGAGAKALGNVTGIVLDFFLMLFVLFFLLRDHDHIIGTLRHILPLSRSQEDRLLSEIITVSKSAVMGSFLTAIAQGVAGGIGMAVAGFPGLFWGTMIGFASFIPVIGTALIWLPATLYLFFIGDSVWAFFLAIWCMAVVGSIDNFLRPLLMQGHSGMSTLLIFFSLLGGIQVFGLIGLIYGPLIFAITLVLFNIYEEEFHHFLDKQDQT